MTTHIYMFGSLCRGEYRAGSDLDVLVCTNDKMDDYEKERFSVYLHERIAQMWLEGNPFAWHLFSESKLVFASDGVDWLSGLGVPGPYKNALIDCSKFRELFARSLTELKGPGSNEVFELSCMFLAVRNFATCFSIATGKACFSRKSPYLIDAGFGMTVSAFSTLENARILSTRGVGDRPGTGQVSEVREQSAGVIKWMDSLLLEVPSYD